MECFFKVFDQRRCRVSRDIEIFPIRIDAKIHRSLVGGTDDTGDAVLLTFIEAFRHQLGQRTVLLITHRPASLAVADRVLRLDGGQVVGNR